jgi:sugar lactone lactonase YvrE
MMHSNLRRALQATAMFALVAALPISAVAGASQTSHHKRLLFVSNLIGSIRIYSAGIHKFDVQLKRTITTATSRPEGIWIDRKGTLYVENGEQYPTQADIEEYENGATSPFFTITDGLNSPGAVAVGSDGTVYVNQLGEKDDGQIGVVVEYAPGKKTPKRTVKLNPSPEYGIDAGGLAFDPQGNLLAATIGNASEVHVFKIAPGSSKATDLGLQG